MVDPKKQLILPGDRIGAGEEYLPGKGTYLDDDGNIYSANSGELAIDKKGMTANLNPKTRCPHMQEVGMKPIGVVGEGSGQVAFVDLGEMGEDRSLIAWRNTAVLHISRIKQGYVEHIKDEVRIGDVVRVKITEISPHTVVIDTLDFDCGVILAYCSRCRKPMVRQGDIVACEECGRKETRKLASDYGKVDIKRWKNAGQDPRKQEK
jgi:exosome complex component CSL4